jgi:hypothetical protein
MQEATFRAAGPASTDGAVHPPGAEHSRWSTKPPGGCNKSSGVRVCPERGPVWPAADGGSGCRARGAAGWVPSSANRLWRCGSIAERVRGAVSAVECRGAANTQPAGHAPGPPCPRPHPSRRRAACRLGRSVHVFASEHRCAVHDALACSQTPGLSGGQRRETKRARLLQIKR